MTVSKPKTHSHSKMVTSFLEGITCSQLYLIPLPGLTHQQPRCIKCALVLQYGTPIGDQAPSFSTTHWPDSQSMQKMSQGFSCAVSGYQYPWPQATNLMKARIVWQQVTSTCSHTQHYSSDRALVRICEFTNSVTHRLPVPAPSVNTIHIIQLHAHHENTLDCRQIQLEGTSHVQAFSLNCYPYTVSTITLHLDLTLRSGSGRLHTPRI